MFKKLLSLLLAVLLVACMAACSPADDDDKQPDSDDPQQTDPGANDPDPENPETPEDPGTPELPEQPSEPDKPVDPEAGMTEVIEEIYATVTVDLRSAPEVDVNNIVGVFRYGERATRIKVSDEWSKIRYQNQEYFVATNCLALYEASIVLPGDVVTPPEGGEPTVTPDLTDFVRLETPETVYVIAESALNLRNAPGMDGEVKAKVAFGVKMERVAMNANWSEVTYNGQTYYAFSEFLTTDDITGEGYTVLAAPQTMYVTASALWVRYFPSMVEEAKVPYTVFEGLHKGDAVQVVALSPDSAWARVVISGSEYYVGYQHLSHTAPDGVENDPIIIP